MNNFNITVTQDGRPSSFSGGARDVVTAVQNALYDRIPMPNRLSIEVQRAPLDTSYDGSGQIRVQEQLQAPALQNEQTPKVYDYAMSPEGEGWILGFSDNGEPIVMLNIHGNSPLVNDVMVNEAGIAVAALDRMNNDGSWDIRWFAPSDEATRTHESLINISLEHRLAKHTTTLD